MELHIGSQVENLYRTIMRKQCENERTILKNLMNIAYTQPEAFAYNLMQAEGYSAIIAGEQVHLIQCIPQNVTFRQDSRCFLELPIMYNNQPAFLTPRNRIIIYHGHETLCHPSFPIAFNFTNVWSEVSNEKVQITNSPQILNPEKVAKWKYEFLPSIGSAGIYSKDQIEELNRKMIFSTERDAIGMTIVSSLTNPSISRQGLHFGNLFDEEALERAKQHYMQYIWGKLSALGNLVAGCIGIFFIIKIVWVTFETFFNAYHLYRTFGLSCKILAAFFHSFTTYFLHQNANNAPRYEAPEAPPLPERKAISAPPLNDDQV